MICTDKVSISSIGKLLDHIQLQIYHFLLINDKKSFSIPSFLQIPMTDDGFPVVCPNMGNDTVSYCHSSHYALPKLSSFTAI